MDLWPQQTLVGGQGLSQGRWSLDRRPEAEHGQHSGHKLRFQPPVCREREQREREQRLDAFQERREKARLQRERMQLQCQRQRLERERLERERLERERMRVERERRKEQQRIMREREELRRQQEQLRAEQERRALRRPYDLDARRDDGYWPEGKRAALEDRYRDFPRPDHRFHDFDHRDRGHYQEHVIDR